MAVLGPQGVGPIPEDGVIPSGSQLIPAGRAPDRPFALAAGGAALVQAEVGDRVEVTQDPEMRVTGIRRLGEGPR